MRSGTQDGQTMSLLLLHSSPASHSALLESTLAHKTSATYSPRSANSSASLALSQSLVNKLSKRLLKIGSTIYTQRWVKRHTPLGMPYWAHTAQERTTSDKDSSGLPTKAGWVTPAARDWKDTPGMATHTIDKNGKQRIRLDQLPRQAMKLTGSNAQTTDSDLLNPALSRWLMGLPPEWDVAAIRANCEMQTTQARQEKCA